MSSTVPITVTMGGFGTFLKNEIQLRQEWVNEFSTFRKVAPFISLFTLAAVSTYFGGFKKEQVILLSTFCAFNYISPRAAPVVRFLLPILVMGAVYDSMRYYTNAVRSYIRVKWPYDFDKEWFGIETENGILTPNEWWQQNTNMYLDVACALFYLMFILMFLSLTGWMTLYKPYQLTHKYIAQQTPSEAARLTKQRYAIARMGPYATWSFFWLTVIGYSTYLWFPAAPPWYVTEYGLEEPANVNAAPLPGGCARFDQLTGIPLFHGVYGASLNVFGAIPSLHISYPCLAMLFCFYFGMFRRFGVFYYSFMCFSAVYLNHHYIVDIIWGSAYVVATFGFFLYFSTKRVNTAIDVEISLAKLRGDFRLHRELIAKRDSTAAAALNEVLTKHALLPAPPALTIDKTAQKVSTATTVSPVQTRADSDEELESTIKVAPVSAPRQRKV